ncbi:hypothetical protein [Hymenobacter properus]|uniref:Right-handed parallel beta-helix repeat-containing protein n=1 Tax=Hymenobacter properus TaxID=2791026 RepID=A0A931BNM3_9BACT|nr:hypothetical protein [Hymenobacter properus]MBF9142735.1 hypothetical protein [Hymenobacter properus]MBR7721543.1 hypothetical protein [Microvirga sp. SRT04]
MRYLFPLFLIFSSCLTFLPGCEPKEDLVQTTGKLEFDRDSVKFDTVFTTIKTVTKRLWVYNRNSSAVKTDVSLAGQQGNTYSLIINGDAGNTASGVTIRGNDSLLVLVRAVLGDNSTTKPFLLEDQINFRTNGNEQNVKLVAYGQNAYFHRADIIDIPTGNRTKVWRNDKPHVIINTPYKQGTNTFDIGVYVERGSTLLIEPGAKIYCHAGATIQVNGTLKINDTNSPTAGDTTAAKRLTVLFRGDRLEPFYNEIPGQWGGIFFTGTSRNNVVRYTEIKNANFGFSLLNTDATNTTPPDLQLENVVIRNISGSNPSYVGTGLPPGGIVGVRSSITATNCLLTNCGEYAVRGYGGTFNLNFCTIANYTPSFQRQTSSVSFSNELRDDQGNPQYFSLVVNLTNSIVWGNYENELELVNSDDYLATLNIRNTLLRTKDFQATTNAPKKPGLGAQSLANLVLVTDPLFIRTSLTSSLPNYRLQPTSPARGRTPAPGTTVPSNDLPNRSRPATPSNPALGAYEYPK